MSLIGHAIRITLGSVFAFSAFSHFKHPHLFLDDVLAYKIVEGYSAWLVAMVLPAFEVAVALVLFSRINHRVAANITAVLMTIFFSAQVSVLMRGFEIDCGCFGGLVRRSVGVSSLTFLVGLLGVNSLLYLNRFSANTGEPVNE